jgi:hypothetical protein
LNGSSATVASAAELRRDGPPRGLAGWLGRSSYALIFGLALLVSLPTWLPPILPLTDLGGHIGRFAVQLDGGRDAQLAAWYSFSWRLLPNLGADILVQGLAPLLGLEPAVRVIVALAAFLQAFGLLAVSKGLHGRITPYAIFALPLVYAHSFLYGFLNYTLALGLLWCSLALWIAMSKGEAIRRRWAVFALVAAIIWLCHLVGWALLCIGAGSQELMRQRDRRGGFIRGAFASVGPLTCLLVPWVVKLLVFEAPTGSGKSEGFFLMSWKFHALRDVFRDQWHAFDILSVSLLVLLIVSAWLTRWTRLDRGTMLAAAITSLCVIVIPQRLLGSFFADERLIEPTLSFALLAVGLSGRGPARLAQTLFLAALLFSGVRLAGITASLWQLGIRSADDLKVLHALPRNAQLVTFRALACPPPKPWTFDRWTHLAGYAVARRHAFSNDQWQVPGGQLLRVHNPAASPFEADDSQIVYEAACFGKPGVVEKAEQVPAQIPFLWVLWSGRPKPLDAWEPLASTRGSVLYRRRALADGSGRTRRGLHNGTA